MHLTIQLFTTHKWSLVAADQRRRLEEEISSMDEAILLHTPIHELSNYLAQKYRTSVPILHKDQITVTQRAAQIDLNQDPTRLNHDSTRPQWVMGTRAEVSLPFTGDPACFHMQPTTFTFHPPHATITENSVIFQIEGVALSPDVLRARIQQMLNEITKNLRYLQTDINRFNSNLYTYAHLQIERQRKKVLSNPDAPDAGFKLRERREKPPAFPEERRELSPPPITTHAPPQPLLVMRDYEEILHLLHQTAALLCHSPSALASMENPTLRSHFLIPLNIRFESRDKRETFLPVGDDQLSICIDGRDIFVAACCFWRGAAALQTTLDQLLATDTWREAKAVLILFNRQPPFAPMLDAVRATVRHHPSFKRELPQLSDTTYLYLMSGQTNGRADQSREHLLTLLAFDVPQSI